jgi:lysyl-tRNA synthetase class 2
VRDAFLAETGVDLARCPDAPSLAAALAERGLPARDHTFDALFFRVFVERVEPKLAEHAAVFLVDYPAPLAALARLKSGAPLFAERFELYIRGVELANGYTELVDPAEQRSRFEADLRARRAQGLTVLPLPEDFLRALELGMPPAGGVSLGVDRLFMLKSGASDIRDVVAFSWESESSGPRQLPS